MNKKIAFLPLTVLLSTLLWACTSTSGECTIKGVVSTEGYEGKCVFLYHTLTSEAYDSTLVKNGHFSFHLNDSMPQVSLLVLKASEDDLFPITLPIVTEQGTIRVSMGELVLTSGTALNNNLQDFLLAVDQFRDKVQNSENDIQQVKNDFSSLLEASILQNIENAVGVYIFRAYHSRLSSEQRADILSRSNDWFREQVEK